MTPNPGSTRVLVGRVVKTQGIKGQVKVLSSGEGAGALPVGSTVYLTNGKGMEKSLTVESSRPHQKMTILAFREVQRIEEAEELVGCSLYLAPENLPTLSADEFYWYQLQGLEVKTEKGKSLGRLEEIVPTGSNDVFVVRKDHGEFLIPATDEVVVHVDLKSKVMVVRPIEGLLSEDDL
jgi:16S rRNA processing protein RimM